MLNRPQMLKDMYRKVVLIFLCALSIFSHFAMAKDLPVMRGIGQDFEADSTIGMFRLSELDASVTIMTFGFTNCPDVCPITLGYLSNLYQTLSEKDKRRVKVLFVSVDPEFDTVPHLKKYLEYYDPDFIGVSPTEKQLQKIAKAFNIKYEKVNQIKIPTNYNRPSVLHSELTEFNVFNHSVTILVLDRNKRVRAIKYSGSYSDQFLKDIRTLIKEDENRVKVESSGFWIRHPVNNARVTALYGNITNLSDTDVELLAIDCLQIAQKSELHLTEIKNNQSSMVHQKTIPINAGQTFEMKPLSYHTMLFGLKKTLQKKETIECLLKFNNNIKVSVQATVK